MWISCDVSKAAFFGKRYILDYIQNGLKQLDEIRTFRAYIGDTFYAYTHGKAFNKRFTELINNTPEKSGDEIAEQFIKKLLKGGKNSESS